MHTNGDTSDLRRLILDETRHLLVTEGYQSLSMRKIARAIGYSATSIYLHFESKDALFHALIDEGFERFYQELRLVVAAHEARPPLERLRALCRCYIDFGLENPEYYEIMLMLHPARMERYPPEKYRRARRSLDVFVEELRAASRQGVLDVDDPRVSASAVWASLHGIVALLIAERLDVRVDVETFIEAAVDQTIGSFRAAALGPAGSA